MNVLVSMLLLLATQVRADMPQTGIAGVIADFFPGGKYGNALHRSIFKPFDSVEVPKGWRGNVKKLRNGLYEQTFVLEAITVEKGGIAQNYDPINFPKGHLAIKGFTLDVMVKAEGARDIQNSDGSFNTVPASRDDVYLHHYTLNKWQLSHERFKQLVAHPDGVAFDEANPFLVVHEAGMNGGSSGPCGPMDLHAFAGAGNEARGKRRGFNYGVQYGKENDDYAWVVDTDDMSKNGITFMFNGHVIDIRNVTDLRGCTECDCKVTGAKIGAIHRAPPLDGPEYLGGLACCHSSEAPKHKVFGGHPAQCPIVEGSEQSERSYYLQYTVAWRPYYPEVKSLETWYFDISDNGNAWGGVAGGTFGIARIIPKWLRNVSVPGALMQRHSAMVNDEATMESVNDNFGKSGVLHGFLDCHIEYFVPKCNKHKNPSCEHHFLNSWTLPYDGDIIANYPHYHTGGLSMRTTLDEHTVCANLPTYSKVKGTLQLTDISACTVGERTKETGEHFKPIPFNKGQELKVEMVYAQDEKPHYGVMAYSVLFVHPKNAQVLEKPNTTDADDVDFRKTWEDIQKAKFMLDAECAMCTFVAESMAGIEVTEDTSAMLQQACTDLQSLPHDEAYEFCLDFISSGRHDFQNSIQVEDIFTQTLVDAACLPVCGASQMYN